MFAARLLFGLAMMRHVSSQFSILAGVALLFLFQSPLSLLQFLSSPSSTADPVLAVWCLMHHHLDSLIITAVVTPDLHLLIYRDAWALTSLHASGSPRPALGVNVDRLRMKTLVLVALLTATATSFVGVIGFVGLVAPYRPHAGGGSALLIPSPPVQACMLSAASVLSSPSFRGPLPHRYRHRAHWRALLHLVDPRQGRKRA